MQSSSSHRTSRGVRTRRYTYVRTIDQPWLLYDNLNDPYQLENRIDDPDFASMRDDLEAMMRDHMASIDDRFLPKESYYKELAIALDHRGKVELFAVGMASDLVPRLISDGAELQRIGLWLLT